MAALTATSGLQLGSKIATETNPLLRSHVFPTATEGGQLGVTPLPAVIHFGGFTVGETQTFKLNLLNTSASVIRMHIIQPNTPFFSIRYTKLEGGLRPGFSEIVEVDFRPTEWRYYYDCIRVHVQDSANLLIPLHGYPVPGDAKIPKQLDFRHCAIGKSVTKKIPLRCTVPIDFDFKVDIVEDHGYFNLEPMEGTILAKGATDILITYTPQTYSTVTMSFDVTLSQFNSKPLRCNVLASAKPGVAMEEHKLALTTANPIEESARVPRPPKHPPKAARRAAKRGGKAGGSSNPLVVNNISIPSDRRGMNWVNKVLNQPAVSESDRSAAVRTVAWPVKPDDGTAHGVVRPRKHDEDIFLMKLRDDAQVPPGFGELALSSEREQRILTLRQVAAEAYEATKGEGEAVKEAALSRRVTVTKPILLRTFRQIRPTSEPESTMVTFERKPGDGLRRRAFTMTRFVQAIWKVIFRIRAAERLAALEIYKETPSHDLEAGADAQQELGITAAAVGHPAADKLPSFSFDGTKVDPFQFPVYSGPTVLPPVPERGAVAVSLPELPKEPPVFGELLVARQCDILGYTELQPAPFFSLCDNDERPLLELEMSKGFFADEVVKDPSSPADEVLGSTTTLAIEASVQRPKGQVWTSAGGLLASTKTTPHSEISPDHWFNPFGLREARPSTVQRKATIDMDRPIFDLVPASVDLMTTSPASGVALPADRSLSNLWVPRLTDPYMEAVLPTDVPALLWGPADLDENGGGPADEDDEDADFVLPIMTMADTFSQFDVPAEYRFHESDAAAMSGADDGEADGTDSIVDTEAPIHGHLHGTSRRNNCPFGKNGPVSRDKCIGTLEDSMSTRATPLVASAQKNLQAMQSLLTSSRGFLDVNLNVAKGL